MRMRDISICFICLVITATLLFIAGEQLDYINNRRQQMKLIVNEPLENAPPSLAFATVAMGAFRGLIVDILWMRADKLKEQGQFFDAKQLAEWITTLQPRFAAVWEFQAWNMAYNISVAIPANQPDQRWRWIKNGYELLRDQGIPLNPKSIELYRELARIFQHKIGGVSDEAHKYYKLQLALAMEPLFDPADNEFFDALAKAPTTFQQISSDPNVATILEALKSSDSSFVDEDEFVNNYLALRQNPERFNPATFQVIENFRGTPALAKFDLFAKAYHLRNTWKLDPVMMQELNKTYGPIDFSDPNKHFPLDWRHPDCHAMYWAIKGLQILAEQEDREIDIQETNTDRIVGHCLQDLFRNGKIFIYDIPVMVRDDQTSELTKAIAKDIFLRPDLRMFDAYNEARLAVIKKYEQIPEARGSVESLKDGHRNMLINAAFSFYQTGHVAQAQRIYNQLRELYPREEFKISLVAFMKKRMQEELRSIEIFNAKEQIIALLRESYFRYALHDDDEAFAREKMAKEIWEFYRNQYNEETRIDLPELPVLRYLALLDFLNDLQYPPNLRRNLLSRISIEMPDLYKQLQQEEEKLRKQSAETG
jgi:hypothetical protein